MAPVRDFKYDLINTFDKLCNELITQIFLKYDVITHYIAACMYALCMHKNGAKRSLLPP